MSSQSLILLAKVFLLLLIDGSDAQLRVDYYRHLVMGLTLIKAKATIDSVPGFQNKVSCADILAMATRDVVALVNNKQ
ncbi:hypothetical protein VNO80_03314 [Phaseolus coccineus]|uniref:Plant heme peroxidase family profile domain-containing protein n=1 Tax=Phaseolus coccineus TaxID=3886 RepID=A0AAN9NRG3_PHACN